MCARLQLLETVCRCPQIQNATIQSFLKAVVYDVQNHSSPLKEAVRDTSKALQSLFGEANPEPLQNLTEALIETLSNLAETSCSS